MLEEDFIYSSVGCHLNATIFEKVFIFSLTVQDFLRWKRILKSPVLKRGEMFRALLLFFDELVD
jgi:hypothetical protein